MGSCKNLIVRELKEENGNGNGNGNYKKAKREILYSVIGWSGFCLKWAAYFLKMIVQSLASRYLSNAFLSFLLFHLYRAF